MEKTLNGKGSADSNPKIIFNPNTAVQAEEPKLNKYGFDLSNADFIKYERENLEAEIIGGVQTQVLTRFNVLLKLSKHPQLNATEVYRANVDLYSDNHIKNFVNQAKQRLQIDGTRITNFIYDLIERLEQYRKDKLTYTEENEEIPTTQPKVLKTVSNILQSTTVLKEIETLLAQAGVVCPKIGLKLFLISLSSKQKEVTHGILQGNPALSTPILQSFQRVLPVEVNKYKTSISDSVLYYSPSKNYWKHKILVLPTIDKLGKKNTALNELISLGEVNRLVTENTQQGTYRANNRLINGNLSFISATNQNYSELFSSDNVIGLPVTNPKGVQKAISTLEIKKYGGLIDIEAQEKAIELLQFIFRELKPVKVVNPYLEQLDIATYFNEDYKLIKQFLQLTNLITMLHQKQLGMVKSGNEIQVEVQPQFMLEALELFQGLWVKEEKELNFKTHSTLIRLKQILKSENQDDYQNLEFLVKEMRAKLGLSPSTFSRHINTLYDYNKLERIGGNKRDGFTYKVISWSDETSSLEKYENFKKEINSL